MIVDIIIIVATCYYIAVKRKNYIPFAKDLLLFGFIFYIYIGTILMYYDQYYDVDHNFVKLMTLVRVCFFSILLSYFLTSLFRRNDLCESIASSRNIGFPQLAMTILSIAVVGVSVVYPFVIPELPLLTSLFDPSSLMLSRQEATSSFPYYGFFSNFLNYFLPLVWLTLQFQRNRLYVPLAFLNLLLLLITGQKAPVIYIFLLWFLAYTYTSNSLKFKRMLFYGITIILFLITIVYLQNKHLFDQLSFETIYLSVNGLFHRIFYGGVIPLLQYIEYFPSIHPHYFLDAPETPPSVLVHAYNYPDNGLGSVNTVSAANMYASLGSLFFAGIAFFTLTLLIFSIDLFIFNKLKSPLDLACYTLFCLTTFKIVLSDWYSVLPIYFTLVLSFYGFFYAIQGILNGIHTTRFTFKSPNLYFSILCLLIMLYFMQGQFRSLLNA